MAKARSPELIPPPDKLLSSVEAAALVGSSDRLRRLVRTGTLAYHHVGFGRTLASMRFAKTDIEAALLEAQDAKAETIYVVGFSNYAKIGFTKYLPGRLIELQQHLPMDLILYASFPGFIADERALHARFASLRLRGEWFLRRGKLLNWINAGCPQ